MNDSPPVPLWMRNRPAQSSTLSEKLTPFLQDADRALADNVHLREQINQLQQDLRHSRAMQDSAADRIDVLDEELAAARRELALLQARMKMFGEAANTIIAEVTKEAEKEPFAPKQREEFRPTDDLPVRPVRPIAPSVADDAASPALAFLAREYENAHG